jgi:hypothetical protein
LYLCDSLSLSYFVIAARGLTVFAKEMQISFFFTFHNTFLILVVQPKNIKYKTGNKTEKTAFQFAPSFQFIFAKKWIQIKCANGLHQISDKI